MTDLRFGLIGTGFMGKAHAIALRSVGTVFPEISAPVLESLVDVDADRATQASTAWGFARSGDDWQALCQDPGIDVINICTPNHLHKDIAIAAAQAGKHIWCEKPLALTGDEARLVRDAAEQADIRTSMGFNYMCNPVIEYARQMIASGELGEIFNFRGSYQEDYMSDARTPFSWRCLRSQGGSGALADLGTHLFNMSEYILGPIASVFGTLTTVHKERPDATSGEMRAVENEDIAQVLMSFELGVTGTLEISRIATGRKCGLCFEVYGSKGSLVFDQERMNELGFYNTADSAGSHGFRTILSGPEHPDYAAFCPAPGHGLGINDLKVIEARNFIQSIATNEPVYSDFRNGYHIQEVIDAIELSNERQEWINVSN